MATICTKCKYVFVQPRVLAHYWVRLPPAFKCTATATEKRNFVTGQLEESNFTDCNRRNKDGNCQYYLEQARIEEVQRPGIRCMKENENPPSGGSNVQLSEGRETKGVNKTPKSPRPTSSKPQPPYGRVMREGDSIADIDKKARKKGKHESAK